MCYSRYHLVCYERYHLQWYRAILTISFEVIQVVSFGVLQSVSFSVLQPVLFGVLWAVSFEWYYHLSKMVLLDSRFFWERRKMGRKEWIASDEALTYMASLPAESKLSSAKLSTSVTLRVYSFFPAENRCRSKILKMRLSQLFMGKILVEQRYFNIFLR